MEKHFQKILLGYELFFDEITTLHNRKGGLNKLKKTLDLADKNKREFTVVYIDISNVKILKDRNKISDTNKLIKIISEGLSENMKGLDFVSRISEFEFIVGLYDSDITDAKLRIKQIEDDIKMNSLIIQMELPILFSYAISQYKKDKYKNVKNFYKSVLSFIGLV